MKAVASIIMGIVILAGVLLAITPFAANYFFPKSEKVVRIAKEDSARLALQQWFNSPEAELTDVQALNKKTSQYSKSWFSFSVDRKAVERYILGKKLEQKEIKPTILNTIFNAENPPASWWQPRAINQKTFFTGQDQGRRVSLIYNPKTKRGILTVD